MPYKHGVTGSSPVVPTIFGPVVQSVSTPACHAGGRRFESVPGRQKAHAFLHVLFLFCLATVGEDSILPRGVSLQKTITLGEFVSMSNTFPFNRTLRNRFLAGG